MDVLLLLVITIFFSGQIKDDNDNDDSESVYWALSFLFKWKIFFLQALDEKDRQIKTLQHQLVRESILNESYYHKV